jgi:hypothetical protein
MEGIGEADDVADDCPVAEPVGTGWGQLVSELTPSIAEFLAG